MPSKKELKAEIEMLRGRLRAYAHDVSVYTHTESLETKGDEWVATPKPGYQGVISPGSKWVVSTTKWRDVKGNMLKHPVTAKVTLESRRRDVG